jgi:hypothetical protein
MGASIKVGFAGVQVRNSWPDCALIGQFGSQNRKNRGNTLTKGKEIRHWGMPLPELPGTKKGPEGPFSDPLSPG